MNQTILKKKITNHIFKNGKKQVSEKILKNSFKSIQKIQKKSHKEILKQTIVNTVPTFRIIKLKKRKSILEIPAFLSSYEYRTSWGLKYLVKTFTSKIKNPFHKELKKEVLSNNINTNEAIKFRDELQKTALKKKKYFKYYRW
jgi:ribosomal protein S7